MRLPRLPAGSTLLLCLLLLCLLPPLAGRAAAKSHVAAPAISDDERFERVVALLAGKETTTGGAYKKLAWLADRIGHRISGSPEAEKAVSWALDEMRGDGLAKVRAEKVMVPHWVRGAGSARIVAPVAHDMPMLALGMSVGTVPEGVTAEVVEVDSIEALHDLGDAARDKIVLFNKVTRVDEQGAGYRETSPLRVKGPSEAAKLGAVATLVRSLGTMNARLPHTGTLVYADDAPKIPAAAITAEDADLLHRFIQSGEPVRVTLTLGCRTWPDAVSANAMGELRGRTTPDEYVVIGAHLDSWDVGAGAIDDGAGVAIVMEAMRLLKELDLTPRRTVRAVLYMNEENGGRGGKAYAADHAAEIARHVAAIESDSGADRPLGLHVAAGDGAVDTVRNLMQHLKSIGLEDASASEEGGSDIAPLHAAGCPVLGLRQDSTRYFNWHHTEADTLDKVDPHTLGDNAVAMAFMAFALADAETPLPRPAITPAAAAH
jgi:hypothetical protein